MISMLSRELINALAKTGRIELIRTLKAFPEKDFTVNELSRASGVPTMTTWRAVKDLKAARIVRTRRVGNAICISITDDRDRLRVLRLIPETDPQRTAATVFAKRLGENGWVEECRLFGSIGKGEHGPGDDVDVAVVYREGDISAEDATASSTALAAKIRTETNVNIVPLCISSKEMARRGGLAAELRDKETIFRR
jgi:predicted nucleotidyltransferase